MRNFDFFSRFLDVAGIYSSEIINYTNIARESAISVKTVQNYFSILFETLIAFELPAWDKSLKRQLSKSSKFYFVDNGIQNAINRRLQDPLTPIERGKCFEQWIINEVRALLSYRQSEMDMFFWRTDRGQLEIDLILGKRGKILKAIEIKAKKNITPSDLVALNELKKEHKSSELICVYEGVNSYQEGDVLVLTYQDFLKKIYNL